MRKITKKKDDYDDDDNDDKEEEKLLMKLYKWLSKTELSFDRT